ncbi:hypothetical protein CKM354_000990600 [Cercospora kikuchii]|uniref:Uncharacterized protein n=1 Tax=Cercospora kikuchii TaxID=84275 RepID=A0A9P3CLP8_9PEZI|nr:uncharacterized protein CKM354_000990600 [Cercospora kikuchii]GIZ46794.1 hypothetical protein CKM354_000990600 [Cercospora kikuchii]
MHLHAVHRSDYYSVPKELYQSSILTRDMPKTGEGKEEPTWKILGKVLIALAVIFSLIAVVSYIYSKIRARRLNRKVRGQMAHLESGSLRKTQNPRTAAKQKPVQSAFVGQRLPHPDEYDLGSQRIPQSYDMGVITKPGASHARQWARPRHAEMDAGFEKAPVRGSVIEVPAGVQRQEHPERSRARDSWEKF